MVLNGVLEPSDADFRMFCEGLTDYGQVAEIALDRFAGVTSQSVLVELLHSSQTNLQALPEDLFGHATLTIIDGRKVNNQLIELTYQTLEEMSRHTTCGSTNNCAARESNRQLPVVQRIERGTVNPLMRVRLPSVQIFITTKTGLGYFAIPMARAPTIESGVKSASPEISDCY